MMQKKLKNTQLAKFHNTKNGVKSHSIENGRERQRNK